MLQNSTEDKIKILNELQLRSVEILKEHDVIKKEINSIIAQLEYGVCEKIFKHKEALLEFFTKHGRTSCSDEHPDNPGRCLRCTLLYSHDAEQLTEYNWNIVDGLSYSRKPVNREE